MSSVISAPSTLITVVLSRDDQRLYARSFRDEDELANPDMGFVTPWWPGAQGFQTQGDSGDLNIGPLGMGHFFELPEMSRGSMRRFAITGTARDQYGQPASFAIAHLYHTADDVEVDVQTADQFGYFYLTSPYFPDAHYIVAYKAGGGILPDIMGTTVNTLVGA